MGKIFDILQTHYRGFFIEKPYGNNAFSFQERENKKIYVAPVAAGTLRDLEVGTEIAFSEVVEGREVNFPGLKNFVYWQQGEQEIFIFDNHNHAFFFWVAAFSCGRLSPAATLVHVDQHTDLRDPPQPLALPDFQGEHISGAFQYSQEVLNVGNFLKPAMASKFFSKLEIIASREALEKKFEDQIVLDIDVDFFAPQMDYIDRKTKLSAIRGYLKRAKLVTIATSPYFMEQESAIEIIKELLSC